MHFGELALSTLYPLLFQSMFSQIDLLFSSTPLEGPEQMALDEILLYQLQKPLLRVYQWKVPCITFGYFQKWTSVQQAFPKSSLIRRWTGGGCVEHESDLTFSLIVPVSEPTGTMAPSRFYQLLHEAIVEVLREHHVMARLTTHGEIKEGEACFNAPRLHDVLLGETKIAGGAQRRSGGSLLHQGSLNFGASQPRFPSSAAAAVSPASSLQPPASIRPVDRIVKSIFSSLASQLSPEVSLIEEKKEWLEAAFNLGRNRYRSVEWQERR
ncbi:MAG TPA: hypothetical protein VJK54_10030 [Chthoniobacterales bacterium]|nr:hypothetical protein [Chthoniobacterales bacterium]